MQRRAAHRRFLRNKHESAVRLLLLLGSHIYRMESRPPVTLALVAVNVLFFLRPQGFEFLPSISAGCLQPFRILQGREWGRLFTAGFLHGDDSHLYYNMASLLWKGSQLEPRMGSFPFAGLVAELLLLSHALTVLLSGALAFAWPSMAPHFLHTCAVGFSAVLFGLKVVLNAHSPAWSNFAGFRIPSKYLCWAELLYIQLLAPNASFLGHLAGILAGLLHVYYIEPLARGHQPFRGLRLPSLYRQYRAFAGAPRFAAGSGQEDAHNPREPPGLGEAPQYDEGYNRAWRGEPGGRARWLGSSRLPHGPTWAHVLTWRRSATVAVLLAIAAATNPDERHFVAFAEEYAKEALGSLPGFALSAMVWLQARTGLGFQHWSFFLFSIARCNQLWFLGAFGVWLPLPLQWAAGLTQDWRSGVGGLWQCASALTCASTDFPAPLEGLLAMNIAAYLAWLLLPQRWMVAHWEVSPANARRRPWTFATAALSHDAFWPLVGNLQMMLTVGPALQEALGAWGFIAVYFAGGIAGNVVAYIGNTIIHKRRLWSCKGATPAVYGMLAALVAVHPYRKFVWLFGIELNSLGLLAAKLAIEYATSRMERGPSSLWGARSNLVAAFAGLAVAAGTSWGTTGFGEWRLPKTLLPAEVHKVRL